MEAGQIIALLVAAIGALFAFIVWLVKVIIRSFNKNTEAMTHLSVTIDKLPDELMNKMLINKKR